MCSHYSMYSHYCTHITRLNLCYMSRLFFSSHPVVSIRKTKNMKTMCILLPVWSSSPFTCPFCLNGARHDVCRLVSSASCLRLPPLLAHICTCLFAHPSIYLVLSSSFNAFKIQCLTMTKLTWQGNESSLLESTCWLKLAPPQQQVLWGLPARDTILPRVL